MSLSCKAQSRRSMLLEGLGRKDVVTSRFIASRRSVAGMLLLILALIAIRIGRCRLWNS